MPTVDTISCPEPHNLSCQGSVPFPEFGGPDESDFHSQSGQWLADLLIVAQIDSVDHKLTKEWVFQPILFVPLSAITLREKQSAIAQ